MKMKNTIVISAILASATALGLPSAAFAQSDSQKSAKQRKQAPKKEKVWTNDDLGSVPAPAPTKQDQTVQSGASEQPAAANQTANSQQPKVARTFAFTNPKTVEDADKSIAWENRDIQAQQEGLDKLRRQIAEAPADQKDRLTKLLEERTQILADTRNELKSLENKKKDMQKPPADNGSAAAEPPSQ
jgi:hypothetical protein